VPPDTQRRKSHTQFRPIPEEACGRNWGILPEVERTSTRLQAVVPHQSQIRPLNQAVAEVSPGILPNRMIAISAKSATRSRPRSTNVDIL